MLFCDQGIIGSDERVVCILTGHPEGSDGDRRLPHDGPGAIQQGAGKPRREACELCQPCGRRADDLGEIIKAIQLYS